MSIQSSLRVASLKPVAGSRQGIHQRFSPRSCQCQANANLKESVDVEDGKEKPVQVPDTLPSKYLDSVDREDGADGPEDGIATPAESDNKFSGSLKGMLLLNLGALLFGSNQVVIKTSEELMSPFALDALRFGAAALCFLPLLPRALKQREILLPSLELGAWLTGVFASSTLIGRRIFVMLLHSMAHMPLAYAL